MRTDEVVIKNGGNLFEISELLIEYLEAEILPELLEGFLEGNKSISISIPASTLTRLSKHMGYYLRRDQYLTVSLTTQNEWEVLDERAT